MSRHGLWLVSVASGAAIAGLLNQLWAMPEFTMTAMPGIFFSMAGAGSVHASSAAMMFFGNWIFYSIMIALLLVLNRRLRGRRTK